MLDKSEAGLANTTVFPCPSKAGKGILISPTVHGNIIVGPTSESISDKGDVSTAEEILRKAGEGARLLMPGLSTRNSIRNFSGLRAEADSGDFIIGEAEGAPGFIDVAGIKSPGLTAAPAIGEYVASILKDKDIDLRLKSSFNPIVERKLLSEMPEKDQAAAIAQNSLYGRIICRCENITEGDIIDAIRRSPGAITLDGVKRRCRAGMGRCQGGFCGPKVQRILAEELNKPLEDVILEKNGSYILTGRTK
jgi:glycerol-3-phosphate dehydrogenase